MSQSTNAPATRLQALPPWLRILLVATPPVLCLLIICAIGAALAVPGLSGQTTGTPGTPQTQPPPTLAPGDKAGQAAGTATALFATSAAADSFTATAVAVERFQLLTQQAETQAAAPTVTVRPTLTKTIDPANLPPTSTPTTGPPVTLTLIECRGQEGTVTFDDASSQSIHAFGRVSFSGVPRGQHHLQVFWLNNPGQNVDQVLNLQQDTAIVFGDPC